MRIVTIIIIILSGFLWGAVAGFGQSSDLDSLIIRLDWLAAGQESTPALMDTILGLIQNNGDRAAVRLLTGLKDTSAIEKQVAIYIWALGFTKYAPAVPAIIEINGKNRSELIEGNCHRALAMLGGEEAGRYLLSQIDSTISEDKKFGILNYLAQMQYEPALPHFAEILSLDPQEYYWKSIFIFGKMGDKGVPFLLERISDKNENVRGNTYHILGQWLIAPEAAEELKKRYWEEGNKENRALILSAMERVSSDRAVIRIFFTDVISKEKDSELVQYSREALNIMDKLEAEIGDNARSRKKSPGIFEKEWSLLYNSMGHKGDYEALEQASDINDEPRLKKLREWILLRNSDEAFYDYQKINDIILMNRFIAQK